MALSHGAILPSFYRRRKTNPRRVAVAYVNAEGQMEKATASLFFPPIFFGTMGAFVGASTAPAVGAKGIPVKVGIAVRTWPE
jgi:hypothetical protein